GETLSTAVAVSDQNRQTTMRTLHRFPVGPFRGLGTVLPLLFCAASLDAQRAPVPSVSSTANDDPVQLEAFEVVMTQDKGYHSPYSGNALRTNEEIMKVPQSITVLTRDMIDDIASVDLSDMLNYIGVGNFQQGDSAYIRGNNAPI